MTEPYLSLYIADETLYIAKKLSTEIKSRVILDVRIDEIVSEDFDEAAKKLGTTVLGILCLWHKDVFRDWGLPLGDQEERISELGVAMDLLSRSLSDGTSVYVNSIETLLMRAAVTNDSVQHFLDQAWPAIKGLLDSLKSGN